MNYENLEKVLSYKDGRANWHTEKRDCLVYLIQFCGGEMYVGSTTNVRRRFAQYIADLTHGKYPNISLQSAFDEAEEFSVYCIEWVDDKAILKSREQFFIDIISPILNKAKAYIDKDGDSKEPKSSRLHRIKDLCKEKGISIVDLSSRIGMSRVSISNMVAGRQSPPIDTLDKIADALGVETWMLLKDPREIGINIEEKNFLSCPKCGAKLQLKEVE